jgi:3-deoxy-D-manno-octulosonic-acid transferase
MLLLNARLSARSYARWRGLPGLARPILSSFALCLAQDERQAAGLRELGASRAASLGDLKTAGEPLAADRAVLAELRRQTGDRPRWLAASTHPGEDEIVADAHRAIAERHPRLLTILAPRHPVRADAIAAMLRTRGVQVARRSQGEPIAAGTGVYLVDTLGEMGLFYRLAGIALIGGSLDSGAGGHNPFEAARLDCAVLHGPDMRKSAALANAMAAADAAEIVGNADELAAAVARLLADPVHRAARAAAASRAAAAGHGVLSAVLDRIAPWLDPLAPVGFERRWQVREPVAASGNARA